MVGEDVETEEGVPPPWIRMVKRSSFAEDRDGEGREGGGAAPPWVRMAKKSQESQHESSFPPMDKLQVLERGTIQGSMVNGPGELSGPRRVVWDRTDRVSGGWLPSGPSGKGSWGRTTRPGCTG